MKKLVQPINTTQLNLFEEPKVVIERKEIKLSQRKVEIKYPYSLLLTFLNSIDIGEIYLLKIKLELSHDKSYKEWFKIVEILCKKRIDLSYTMDKAVKDFKINKHYKVTIKEIISSKFISHGIKE